MARTELFRKFEEQIQAIKSVAQANQRIAETLDERANLAKFVIDLVKAINCLKFRDKPCGEITFSDLEPFPSAQLAYSALGFQTDKSGKEGDLIALCNQIEKPATDPCPGFSLQTITPTPKPEPPSSPTTPPPERAPRKKE